MIGDRPVGPDGRESELVAGRPFTAEHLGPARPANRFARPLVRA